ncbi:TIGR03985 family CRISPR-associated protein [Cyanobacterium stanieri LEGE 03274]|uniref:TIGR03985 family CRISPR-associated protein n=1 Tax=Cyanobacterium stanieri LEGE 03274 TaxID=1828756 RepID=A0ABR9V3Y9_9CHRO|nr:TIGR03985 family CRISPR-associated protein [Cyanobacterium stanieri]MBE9222615.1 TIGR03985 family CRISPR-associated protein [Cyanobacterium stanieri LEGE 03274]
MPEMPETPLYRQCPPSATNLWSIIDTPKNLRYPTPDNPRFEKAQKSLFDNIKKAFRLYAEVMSFYDQSLDFYFIHDQITFSQGDWRNFLNQENNREYLNDSVKNWLVTFGIRDNDWLTGFQDLYGIDLTQEQKQKILNLIPFECLQPKNGQNGIRTFNNDFIGLAKRGFLISGKKSYGKLSLEDIEEKLTVNSNVNSSGEITNLYEFVDNLKFDEVLISTSENLKDKQRFFIKLQHIVDRNTIDKIQDIIFTLRDIWEKEEIPLIRIKYASSSQREIFEDLIIYPICLFYNQRGIYLTGYGPKPGGLINYLGYYNYRLDHFQELDRNQYIFTEEWDEENYNIHLKLFDKKDELQEETSDDIYSQLQDALGVDLHREIKTMLLHFPQDFHTYYIENTKRHDTFKRLSVRDINKFWQNFEGCLRHTQTTLTNDDKQLINEVISNNPDDAYYVMDYRHGKDGGNDVEADVIMRLRSWGHNVEILAPADLRKRMKEDSQKLWQVYE